MKPIQQDIRSAKLPPASKPAANAGRAATASKPAASTSTSPEPAATLESRSSRSKIWAALSGQEPAPSQSTPSQEANQPHGLGALFGKLLSIGAGKELHRSEKVSEQVNAFESQISPLSDTELAAMTAKFKARLANGEKLDDLAPEAFAVVREEAKRKLGLRPFDVQVMGGAALHFGGIAEMGTGEGKTLAAAGPVYLNALEGKGVHVITTNDYLAKRDAEKMGRVYKALGLSVGAITSGMTPAERRAAYNCDVTYGTANEFGFDYLRDNMAKSKDEIVQREHHFALVDEVDSILIDEARTPLIISGQGEDNAQVYAQFAQLAAQLEPGVDYKVKTEDGQRTVVPTEKGIANAEKLLGVDNLYSDQNSWLVGPLYSALKAKELFKRDRDYVVQSMKEGEAPGVQIVDEFTGRVLEGRRYSDGLHQAIEAKEGVEIRNANQTYASISLQNYFRQYSKLAGMTGTASSDEQEFSNVYKLDVVTIPPNKPSLRIDQPDIVYRSEEAKFQAIAEDIVGRYQKGQPVLVGTTSVENSEKLSKMLEGAGIPHTVLNAKLHEKEAAIVAEAGRKGAVTVATNMAGRGTDIQLGGNPEFVAEKALKAQGLAADSEAWDAAWPAALESAKAQVKAEKAEVLGLGGLYVIGTERHESRRVDNQLRGRAARQGDPGETRFYLSLEDTLVKHYQSGLVKKVLDGLHTPEGQPIDAKAVHALIETAQAEAEHKNAEQRKNTLDYDEVMNAQRKAIYKDRRRVLMGEEPLRPHVKNMIADALSTVITQATKEGSPKDWDLQALWTRLGRMYPISLDREQLVAECGGPKHLDPKKLIARVQADAAKSYGEIEQQYGPQLLEQIERHVLLGVVDHKWRDQLSDMEELRDGVGLRTIAQQDPLIEYKLEGYTMFGTMKDELKEDTVALLFHTNLQRKPTESAA